jgi:hypothetical protein
MGPEFLHSLRLGAQSAVRADLVDPPIRPVKLERARIGTVELQGTSAISSNGETLLYVQATQVQPGWPTNLAWTDANSKVWPISWHTGFDVAAGPVGANLLGAAQIKGAQLPLRLQGMSDLEALPTATPSSSTWVDLARLPLVRLLGEVLPVCNVDTLLDPSASTAARARGTALVAELCGSALSASSRQALAGNLGNAAKDLRDPDERFDTLTAISSLGVGLSAGQRMRVESARTKHQAYDEILMAWAEWELAQALPKGEVPLSGLWLWLEARQYGRVLLTALANHWDSDPGSVGPICAAVHALGIRESAIGVPLACDQAKITKVVVRRQSFDNEEDGTLHVSGGGKDWVTTAAPGRIAGGHGEKFLAVGGKASRSPGEIVWGPLAWPGQRFGLLAGGGAGGLSITIEANENGQWKELAHLASPASINTLSPQIIMLPAHSPVDVRVRMASKDHRATTFIDALTFVDFKGAR